MNLNDKLIQFLNDAHILSNCSILLSNRDIFIYSALCSENDIFTNSNISEDLRELNNCFVKNSEFTYATFLPDHKCINLVDGDNINYVSQIILPIFHEKLDGTLVLFSTNREFLKSNLKFAKTTQYFVEKLCV